LIGQSRLFRWDHATSHPVLLVLLLLGWTIEAFDERYGSVLVSRDEPPTAALTEGPTKGASAATERAYGHPCATVGEEGR
jgi:hypothetical protein